MRQRVAVAVPLLVGALIGCGRPGPASREPAATAPAGRKAPAEPAVFRPSPDGRLKAEQVERYVAVQRRISEAAAGVPVEDGKSAAASLAALVSADLRAARDLGWAPGEYRWVKERIAEARARDTEIDAGGLVENVATASVKGLEARRDRAGDAKERARLDQEIARLRSTLRDARDPRAGKGSPEAVLENRRLLERYRDQLPD